MMNKKLTNYFKMGINNKLTLAEYLTYTFICSYSNGKESHITISSLMNLTGIKKADTITKHTNKLQELGLLKKTYNYSSEGKKLVTYHISQLDKDFICISNDILNKLKTNEIAFAIKLAALRLYGTNKIMLSNNEIIKRLSISKTSFYRYMNVLISEGIAIKIENGYMINPDIFFVFKNKTDKAKILEKTLLSMVNNGSTYSKVFASAYSTNYDGINNIEKFLDWCLSGCPGLNAVKTETEKIKEIFTF